MTLYLSEKTRKQLIKTVEQQMVKAHVPSILKKGFEQMMSDDKKEDLQRMYSLFTSVNALEELEKSFEDYIEVL